ncbi:sigma 54-interacting transcriptional regulator [Pullulanibacillus sp. KACC 23026]|uniref:sigma 54-interacting transcriptional regulator n=1 Tax=Pullulanibacillus sp. KACC 23026 TaxID=3028315 RepID=UPI0023AF57C0|nr:sigma 54-interacting transcriptional regulator [Pullulanibacillus sp. KACC 23026]WEG14867.1 sigma 54-interacting transcriptional regulator [Pullulanibacillus sp. KACC 23026]
MKPKEFKGIHNDSSSVEEGYLVMDWMKLADTVQADTDLGTVIRKMTTHPSPDQDQDWIITDSDGHYLGIVTPIDLLKLLQSGAKLDDPIPISLLTKRKTVNLYDSIVEVPLGEDRLFPVIDNRGRIQGQLTNKALLFAYQQLLREKSDVADVLDIILETAYEGIAVVNSKGTLIKMNEAYKNFLGVKDEDVLYKSVEEVIENTRLHITVQTGIPERAKLQTIQGQSMVVHRIPIWRNNKIMGAVGILIFEGVTELYKVLEKAIEENRSVDDIKHANPFNKMDKKKPSITFETIIHESEEMTYCKSIARRAARTEATVLITGESGTGKEMFAQAIHNISSHSKGEFVAVNCAAIPENLLESELFGYEEGAFTGAKRGGHKGRFELANGGTLFLDEIGDMPLIMQAKILRVLQEKEFQPVGSNRRVPFTGRVIAATHVNLEASIKNGEFREDLYYRLNVIHLRIPPLRERRQDIPALLSHFLQLFCTRYRSLPKTFSLRAVEVLMTYDWPGNTREVMNLVEQLVTLVVGPEIQMSDLPERFLTHSSFDYKESIENKGLENINSPINIDQLKESQKAFEKNEIMRMLEVCNGNKSEAARRLGIHRTTLYQKLKRLGIV